jgi:predicted amidohydrolase
MFCRDHSKVRATGRFWILGAFVVLCIALFVGVALLAFHPAKLDKPITAKTVRVAAIQCYSCLGKTRENCELIERLVRQAAGQKAQIVVLPECAVPGYMNPALDLKWSRNAKEEDGELPVESAAETVPGPSSRRFGALAQELSIYLALPLLEAAGAKYFNSLLLFDPSGVLVAHHRKQSLWSEGDGQWATKGDLPVQVVSTPFGRLGLMICYDFHALPAQLKAAQADIVCYAVGWYGPNTENWYREIFPRRYVVPNNFAVIAANWSGAPGEPNWQGQGYSCVIARDGSILAMAKTTEGSEIVIADIPLETGRK